MFKKISISLLLFAAVLSAAAFKVSLRVISPDGSPEPFATCRIFDAADSVKAVAGGVTDTLGLYSVQLPAPGEYRLAVEVPGAATVFSDFSISDADPDANLGDVTYGASTLGEVVVTAQRPLVVKEIDRIGYDVQADDDSKTSSLNEILRKVPMVSVDADGTIRVNGSTNFVIYKNGRPNSAMSKNAKELFKGLPASMIKKVEVITEPGARYDAEGIAAILNIVTVENSVIKGAMGSASVTGSVLSPFRNANIWLTSQIDKVTFSLNGGTQYMSERASENTSSTDYIYDNGSHLVSQSDAHNKGPVYWAGLEASYEMDSLNLFTAEGNMFYYSIVPEGYTSSSLFDAAGNILSSYRSKLYYPDYNYLDLDATVAYQRSTRRKGETLQLSYMISTTRQNNHEQEEYFDIVGDMFPYSARDNRYLLNFIEHTFQFDWSRPLRSNQTLDLGAKYVLRRNHSKSDFNYVDWELRKTDFRHITDIAAAYAQYSLRLGKVNLRAGLRYEFSNLRASYPNPSVPAAPDTPFSSKLSDWVPSAAVSWNINDANSLSFNYSTRISRPGISYLNPAQTISPTSVSMGNPDLESARFQNLKLSYMLIRPRVNFSFAANYSFSSNALSSVNDIRDNIMYRTYGNVGSERYLSFMGYVQWSPSDKTRLMFNLRIGHDYYSQLGETISAWGGNSYIYFTQKLPWRLEAQLSAFAMFGGAWSVYQKDSSSFWNSLYPSLSLKRSFLKDDRLSVSIGWSNIGKPHTNRTFEIVNGPYTGTRTYSYRSQDFALSVSFRFGSLNARVKKTKNTIQNDDLSGQKSSSSGSSSK